MRTIFITPLLFKRFDRAALRRGEEGQAIVLVALVVVGIVAMVGLAIDGGLGYLESQRLQRAADSAALAGVSWMPTNREIADARAQLSAESNGIKVSCYYNSSLAAGSAYNNRCKRSTWTEMLGNEPEARYYFESDSPASRGVRYRVKLGKMQTRFFLGVIGFPNYPILRTAVAEYTRTGTGFGSSFNYLGTMGVAFDHYMRCDMTNPADCSGDLMNFSHPGAIYQRYALLNCETGAKTRRCAGSFWNNITGTSAVHSGPKEYQGGSTLYSGMGGDAFNPIRDGGTPAGGNNNIVNEPDNSAACSHTNSFVNTPPNDKPGWYGTWLATTTGCPQKSGNVPIQNYDYHPDSPEPKHGFGYEIGITVDENAIYKYTETVANLANHTNLNITIFDGAMNDIGSEKVQGAGPSDQYERYTKTGGGPYDKPPYLNFYFQNEPTTGGGGGPGNNNTPAITWQSKNKTSAVSTRSSNAASMTPYSINTLFPDRNDLELRYNDMRTRFTLYGPPSTAAIPSIYANVQDKYIGSLEMSDMSIRSGSPAITSTNRNGNFSVSMPVRSNSEWEYCYVIYDDIKVFWNNTRDVTNPNAQKPPWTNNGNNPDPNVNNGKGNGLGPDYAYVTQSTTYSPGLQTQPDDKRYAYVCPGKPDYRWNRLRGTPTARYGKNANWDGNRPTDLTVQENLTSSGSTVVSPVVTGTNSGTNYDPGRQNAASIWTMSNQVVDPLQDCRPAAVNRSTRYSERNDWPLLDSDNLVQWGHNRIPFNMAYGDPLVNRAWTASGNATSSDKYYTLYYSFRGWRCEWDFDSSYSYDEKVGRGNPLKDPNAPPDMQNIVSPINPSLSFKERELAGTDHGKYDRHFVTAHPGLVKNAYLEQVLKNAPSFGSFTAAPAAQSSVDKDKLPFSIPDHPFDREFGLQPYFHLRNIAWDSARTALEPIKRPDGTAYTNNDAPVRSGTYMLHVQTFGGFGTNRYAVKAEYENAKNLIVPAGNVSVTFKPVPNVFALTTMSLYLFANKTFSGPNQKVLIDMAWIPPDLHGTTAVLELFDPADVSGNPTLELCEPSGYGPRVLTKDANGIASTEPEDWSIPLKVDANDNCTIYFRKSECPYSLNAEAISSGQCVMNTSAPKTNLTALTRSDNSAANDTWFLISFEFPSFDTFQSYKTQCAANGVPENQCYYFSINFNLTSPGKKTFDAMTWQLKLASDPIHLVNDE